ncbi:MAG: c-type cytochrome [Pikeienuella sp.]
MTDRNLPLLALVFAWVALLPATASARDRLAGHGGPVMAVTVSADGTAALSASFDYSVGVWDLAGGPPRWLEGHRAAVNAVAFHPDGQSALSAGDDFALILWDLGTGILRHRFEGHRGKIMGVDISPGGRVAATAGWDGRIGLWDLVDLGHLGWLEGHQGPVNDVVFRADGTLLSASADGTVRLWDRASRAEIGRPVSNGFGVNRIVLGPGEAWLAYGAVDGTIRLLDQPSGLEIADLTPGRRPILALALSQDGERLAVGDGEGHILIADTGDWRVVRDFRAALRGPIWALAWAGDRLIAGGIADEAAIWPVGTSEAALFAAKPRHFQRAPSEMGNGERQFVRKCAVCHTLGPDGARRAGPSLWGVFGRQAGTLPDYRYSDALRGSAIVWDATTIDRLFDEGPEQVTPGSKMPMQRIAKAQDRADLIAYLKSKTGAETPSLPFVPTEEPPQ